MGGGKKAAPPPPQNNNAEQIALMKQQMAQQQAQFEAMQAAQRKAAEDAKKAAAESARQQESARQSQVAQNAAAAMQGDIDKQLSGKQGYGANRDELLNDWGPGRGLAPMPGTNAKMEAMKQMTTGTPSGLGAVMPQTSAPQPVNMQGGGTPQMANKFSMPSTDGIKFGGS
jgi:hypothetical protein